LQPQARFSLLAGLSLQHSLELAAGRSPAASVAFGSATLAGSDLGEPAQQEADMINLLFLKIQHIHKLICDCIAPNQFRGLHLVNPTEIRQSPRDMGRIS
jgi:hypothetical protein